MLIDELKVFIQDLEGGNVTSVDATVPGASLEVLESELSFPIPVRVYGQVYLAKEQVVACLSASTSVELPCRICNEGTRVSLHLDKSYHTWPVSHFVNGRVDCLAVAREGLLLLVPQFAECHEGKCPAREALQSYVRSESPSGETEGYTPFAGLSMDLAVGKEELL